MKKKTPMATLKQFLHNNGYFVRQEITDRIEELLKEDEQVIKKAYQQGSLDESRAIYNHNYFNELYEQ